MERRRKAFGLRKLSGNDDNKNDCSSKAKEEYYEKKIKVVKGVKGPHLKTVVPKQNTPKRHTEVSSVKDSPGSPLQSPGIQPIFPRALGSPEIEVSWDWGCSQAPRDTTPLSRRVAKVHQPKPTTPKYELPTLIHCPRIWGREISEEENMERLAFYKNILSQPLKCGPEVSNDITNNNTPQKPQVLKAVTPLHHPRNIAKEVEKNESDINAFFDDSADELMLEFSQAVEEKLKKGVETSPFENVKIPSNKHAHSPIIDEKTTLKRICHGKNLFPDSCLKVSPAGKRKLSLRSPQSKMINSKEPCSAPSNDNDLLFFKAPQANPVSNNKKGIFSFNDKTVSKPNVNNISFNENKNIPVGKNSCSIENKILSNSTTLQKSALKPKHELSVNNNEIENKCPKSSVKNIEKNTNTVNPVSCDITDKFRTTNNVQLNRDLTNSKSDSSVLTNNPVNARQQIRPENSNKDLSKSKSGNSAVINMPVNQINLNRHLTNSHSRQVSKPSNTDVNLLLDDDFDNELSSLDFDSICCTGEVKEDFVKPVIQSAPKVCTQEEIEAKRIAALNRLRLKKKR